MASQSIKSTTARLTLIITSPWALNAATMENPANPGAPAMSTDMVQS